MAEVPSSFEQRMEEEGFLEYLKTLNPSHFDYEVRSLMLGKPKLVEKLLLKLDEMFLSSEELDLKITYLQRVVEVGG